VSSLLHKLRVFALYAGELRYCGIESAHVLTYEREQVSACAAFKAAIDTMCAFEYVYEHARSVLPDVVTRGAERHALAASSVLPQITEGPQSPCQQLHGAISSVALSVVLESLLSLFALAFLPF